MAYDILIVDDSVVVRKVLMKTFGMTDIQVQSFQEAQNGKVGLEKMKQQKFDIVFLDINMPVMNGVDFMKQMVSDPALANTPVVVISTEGSKDRLDELNACGIKAFLRKPVSPETLVEAINKVVGGLDNV